MKSILDNLDLNYLNKEDLTVLAIDVLVRLLDESMNESYNSRIFLKIDKACNNKVKEYNKDFGTNFSSIYQVLEHYKYI